METSWTGGAPCKAAACTDRLPARGAVAETARLLAEPRCFGAETRDTAKPCRNQALDRLVLPTPSDALVAPNAACTMMPQDGLVHPCAFGVAEDRARADVVLLGDSHAGHWRGAAEVAAQALRWHGISITHSGCPFSLGTRHAVAKLVSCAPWNKAVVAWLRQHPEIHTILTSAYSDTPFVDDAVAGYAAAYRAIPRSVKHIVVLRDDPVEEQSPAECLDRLLARHKSVVARCAAPRSAALSDDPAFDAAQQQLDPRLAAIDLTSASCSARLCFSVVGGVLVHKDTDSHLTSLFSTTLGPLLLRQLRALHVT